MRQWLDRLAVGAAVVVLVGLIVAWIAAGDLTAPARRFIGRPPLDLEASNVTFASGSGALIHGWLSHGSPRQGVVLLLHGVRNDRREMLSRALFLHKLGYSVLLIDFQAHAESQGTRVTFGELESRDVVGAIQYLRHILPDEPVGVIGVSMGAAAFVLAQDRPAVEAVVLDSLYPTLGQAVVDRLRRQMGPIGAIFAPLLTTQLHPRFGIDPDRLKPIDRIGKMGVPVLVIGGTGDRYHSTDEAQALFAAASEPKELWEVAGASRVDLHDYAKAEYERRVAGFLAKYLRPN